MICGKRKKAIRKTQKEQENNQIHEIGHFEKNSKMPMLVNTERNVK